MPDPLVPAAPTPDPPPPLPSAHDLVVSLIRTIVPVVVGSVLGWLATVGLDLGAEGTAVIQAITGLCIVGYYALVRWLETRRPGAGVLLGRTAQPVYTRTPAPSALAGLPAVWRTMEEDRPVTIVDQPYPGGYVVRTETGDEVVVPVDAVTFRQDG